ncbi:MAG: hypothetical protein PCFJNLEI_04208 [Verrucomicrobiae bacterium]|nr:hypothetical protein [Verrucomicrobiae bacterium]
MPVNFAELVEDKAMCTPLAGNVWLMDDHRWAICAWEEHRLAAALERLALVHVDYHWDSLDEYDSRPDDVPALLAADLPMLRNIVAADELIRYDSFIAPAVRRGLVDEIHFLCRQDDGEPLEPCLVAAAGAAQHIHESVAKLAAVQLDCPYLFDLCLDYFCDAKMEGEGPVWPDAEVLAVVEPLRPLVEAADAVTVSLSFRYSGTADDTRHLAALVLPRLQAWR